nr:MAG TPA: hypothetical protein [Caudoviricetes sp.]
MKRRVYLSMDRYALFCERRKIQKGELSSL